MSFRCIKASESGSRSQYSVEGVVQDGSERKIPFYMMVLPFHASFQTVANAEGERLLDYVIKLLGEPSRGPEVVKGGACDGETGALAEELDVHTAMISVVWEENYDRRKFMERVREVFGPCIEG